MARGSNLDLAPPGVQLIPADKTFSFYNVSAVVDNIIYVVSQQEVHITVPRWQYTLLSQVP
jgi:hypothetical protein